MHWVICCLKRYNSGISRSSLALQNGSWIFLFSQYEAELSNSDIEAPRSVQSSVMKIINQLMFVSVLQESKLKNAEELNYQAVAITCEEEAIIACLLTQPFQYSRLNTSTAHTWTTFRPSSCQQYEDFKCHPHCGLPSPLRRDAAIIWYQHPIW